MKQDLFALSLGFAGVILAVNAAEAQAVRCAPRGEVVARLADRYTESRRAIGVAANQMVMEVYASRDSGSWSITVTTPDGLTCLVASGQGFEALADDLPAPGDPA